MRKKPFLIKPTENEARLYPNVEMRMFQGLKCPKMKQGNKTKRDAHKKL